MLEQPTQDLFDEDFELEANQRVLWFLDKNWRAVCELALFVLEKKAGNRKRALGQREERVLRIIATGHFKSSHELAVRVATANGGNEYRNIMKAVRLLKAHGLVKQTDDGLRLDGLAAAIADALREANTQKTEAK